MDTGFEKKTRMISDSISHAYNNAARETYDALQCLVISINLQKKKTSVTNNANNRYARWDFFFIHSNKKHAIPVTNAWRIGWEKFSYLASQYDENVWI